MADLTTGAVCRCPSHPFCRMSPRSKTHGRQAWKVTCPLSESLLIVPCGRMAGATDFVERHRWAAHKINALRRLTAFAHGIPSHDTRNDVMNALPAELFSDGFIAWIDD